MEHEKLSLTVEQQANSQENASVLLFDRLSNPVIKKKIIDLLCEAEIWATINESDHVSSRKEDGTFEKDEEGHILYIDIPHKFVTREKIESNYDKTLERIKSFTEIDFTSQEPRGGDANENEVMSLGFRMPTGEKLGQRQLSIVEAHEKGHSMRDYSGDFFRKHFSSGFDLSAVPFSDDEYNTILKVRGLNNINPDEKLTFDEHKENFYNYLFSGDEIVERMSQLKNYFGFRGDELFTSEHLRYAREHYVKDTGLDNRMTQFFKAITLEKEEEFVRLVNSSGA